MSSRVTVTSGVIEEAPIFALASAAGRGAVAILRLSGAGVGEIVAQIAGSLPRPRRAALRSLRAPNSEILDQALVLWFPAPSSFTGESCAELQLHGGRAVLQAVTAALLELGARPAQPGEFSRRAFLNGKLDLLEAEAMADLVAAETESQRRQAMRQMEGGLSELLHGWASSLLRVLAFQEALIDFPDEDLPAEVEKRIGAEIGELAAAMSAHILDHRRGERVREGLMIAVVGPPNVGKSSLVNRLAGQSVAIVSPLAGTTRDTLEVRLDLGGVLATLVDTAGLRETTDPIEAEGVRRARRRLDDADLVISVFDAREPVGETLTVEAPMMLVANKCDLVGDRVAGIKMPTGAFSVCALTGAGFDDLRRALINKVRDLAERAGPPPLTRERHRAALADAAAALDAAVTAPLPELRAEDLRAALYHLGRITGHVGVEDLLDTIFGTFCIGK